MSRLDDLGAERQALLDKLAEVTAEIEPLAVAAVAAGEPKRQVAMRAAITRPTLYGWIRSSGADTPDAGGDEQKP